MTLVCRRERDVGLDDDFMMMICLMMFSRERWVLLKILRFDIDGVGEGK